MKLRSPFQTVMLAAALLLVAGVGSHLAAQAPVNEIITTSFQPISVTFRSYSGTATQTTAAGMTTTGTFALTVFKGGNLSATTTFNGISTVYGGSLPRVSSGGIKGTRSGFLLLTSPVATNVNGSVGYATTLVPLIVDRATASGGLQNIDGSTLTFYATRDAMIMGGNP